MWSRLVSLHLSPILCNRQGTEQIKTGESNHGLNNSTLANVIMFWSSSRSVWSVLNSVGLVPSWVLWVSCHHAIMTSWVQNFSYGYFMGLKYFLVGISWSQIFSCGYFVGPRFFLVVILWVQNFVLWVFCGSKIFSRGYFICPKFYDFQ